MKTKYTVDYFINKFEKIPESEVGVGSLMNHCALWHCRAQVRNGCYTKTKEAVALGAILMPITYYDDGIDAVWNINDGHVPKIKGSTPKQRILNALKQVKKQSKN